jgi:hypothetical protein
MTATSTAPGVEVDGDVAIVGAGPVGLALGTATDGFGANDLLTHLRDRLTRPPNCTTRGTHP